MAEIINLRMARKAAKRAAGRQQAAANRARHGQSRAQRERATHAAEQRARLLDGAWRESPDEERD